MLQSLIQSLSKEEIRHHKLLLNSINKGANRLDLELFDFLKRNPNPKAEDEFRDKFYSSDANPYYRLKNRVFKQVFRNLLHLHNGNDQYHEVLENIEASRIFYKKEAYELCEYYLLKAEKKALKLDDFDYLNIIYRELIKLSYERHTINPEKIIAKQKQIHQKQEKIKELNNVLAIVNHQLKRTQNLGKGNKEINLLLEKTIEKYAKDTELVKSYQFQYAIYQAISQHLLRQQQWESLFAYVNDRLAFFSSHDLFSKSNHESKLQMITYLVNAAFMNKEYEKSLKYTEELYDQMLLFNKTYYHKFLFFYYQALVMNWSVSNREKAKKVLYEIKDDREFVSNSYYIQFIMLNLSVLHFQDSEFEKALLSINTLFKSSHYSNFENELKVQLNLFKAVVEYELEEFEIAQKLLEKLMIDHELDVQVENWVEGLSLLIRRESFELSESLKSKVNQKINLDKGEFSGFFAFNHWLKDLVA